MKYLLTSLLLLGGRPMLYCQDTQVQLNSISDRVAAYVAGKRAEIVADSVADKYLSHAAFSRFFDKYFTVLNYDKETFTDGNSASLKVSDNQTRLNLTLSKKSNNSIFSIGTALNITDNSGTLFSANKPAAGTQFFINHSLLIGSARTLNYDEDFKETNYQNRRYVLDSVTSVYVTQRPLLLSVLTGKLSAINTKIDSLRGTLAILERLNARPDAAITAAIIDCRGKLTDADASRAKTSADLQGLRLYRSVPVTIKDIEEGIDDASVGKELNAEGVTTFRLQWLSTGISYNRNNYATYDSNLVFAKRIDQKFFDNWSFLAGYNIFWQRTDQWIERNEFRGFNSLYGNITYSLTNSNSYASLKESNLDISRNLTNNDTVYEFSTSQKLRDISGKTFKHTWIHKTGLQATGMLGKKQFGGINLLVNAQMEDGHHPIYNAHIGGLFHFIDSFDEKAKVNFELFLAFSDLGDVMDSGKSTWQRKEIGITASVPFSKVFFR